MKDEFDKDWLLTNFHSNILTKGKTHGIPHKNIIEALIAVVIIALIILIIPFTKVVTNVLLIVLCLTTFIVFIRGYKRRSISSIIKAEKQFKKNRRILHLRSPEYKKEEVKLANEEYTDESFFQSVYRLAKERIVEFVDKYSES